MFLQTLPSILFFIFLLAVSSINANSLEDALSGTSLENFQKDSQFSTSLDDLFQKYGSKRAKLKYDIYSSNDKKFVLFRIYKVASGTLTHFFQDQVADLTASRPKGIPKKFDSYFKFAFVRNPWDRIVSCYFHKVLTKDDPKFKECFDKDFDYFVDYINKLDVATADRHIRLQTKLIPVEQCNFIGKLDNFAEDLQYICEKLNLEMSKISHRHKSEHAHYSTYYTPHTRSIIAKKYREDIETFGFTFETE